MVLDLHYGTAKLVEEMDTALIIMAVRPGLLAGPLPFSWQ